MKYKTVNALEPRTENRVWGTEVFIVENDKYLGKINTYLKGTMGGLQLHVEKDEAFYILSGEALVTYDDGEGNLQEITIGPGEGFHIPPGAAHRVYAISDCTMAEWSTPHYTDRIRLEEHYGLPIPEGEGELQTTREE